MKPRTKAGGILHTDSKKETRNRPFPKSVPTYFILIILVLNGIYFFVTRQTKPLPGEPVREESKDSEYKLFHKHKQTLIYPLLLIENNSESKELLPVKRDIDFLINTMIRENVIMKSSVYLNRLNHNEWFAIHPEEYFSPASLLKIPYLMIYLKQFENDPSVLDKKLTLTEKLDAALTPEFKSKSIEVGKAYSVRDLLSYMIIHSDNNATYLLYKNIDTTEFQNLIREIDLPAMQDMTDRTYKLNVISYSRLLQVLYFSTYLKPENSEYALSLLAQCNFEQGMMTAVPKGITVAHKFGESGLLNSGDFYQLHESAIIYLENNPIVVTIFTQGREMSKLPEAIGRITQEILRSLRKHNLDS